MSKRRIKIMQSILDGCAAANERNLEKQDIVILQKILYAKKGKRRFDLGKLS